MRPIVLSIAGSDPSGGAGIQADLKAIEANGGYAVTAVTAITVQNTRGVLRSYPVGMQVVRDQIEFLAQDLEIAALKSGMLVGEPTISGVAATIRERLHVPYVLDPVLRSTDGYPLMRRESIDSVKEMLFPLATVVTPNLDEVRELTGHEVRDVATAKQAGRELLRLGPRAALVKGGHLPGDRAQDVLLTHEGARVYDAPKIEGRSTHGSGCLYSASIATWLARGLELEDAVARAKAYVTESIRRGLAFGSSGLADPLHVLQEGAPARSRASREAE